jgi:hypothetical protein
MMTIYAAIVSGLTVGVIVFGAFVLLKVLSKR